MIEMEPLYLLQFLPNLGRGMVPGRCGATSPSLGSETLLGNEESCEARVSSTVL